MKNIFVQILISISLFVLTWFAISRIDFIGYFNLENSKKINEAKLGKLMFEQFVGNNREIKSDSVALILEKIKKRLAKPNSLHADSIHIHLVQADEINAFALPGDQLVINSSLVTFCDNPEQLTGVLAHELAHIQKDHVMKKLVKEVGLSVLISVAGGKGSGILKKITERLSSSAYDRQLEREADETGAAYLLKSNIDPENFANLLVKFSTEFNSSFNVEWISSHPESKERAAHILEVEKPKKFHATPVLNEAEWVFLKKACTSANED